MLIKDMKNIGSIYNVNLLQLLPRHLMAEYDYPFCDIADFERQSIAAVEQFFATDAERAKPYSTASTRRRRKYIEELYKAFSATTGYNPPLVFEKKAANSLGAYNNERNKIILNKLLLEEENPRKSYAHCCTRHATLSSVLRWNIPGEPSPTRATSIPGSPALKTI